MAKVTLVFAQALARAAGLVLTDAGELQLEGRTVRAFSAANGQLDDADYFGLIEWASDHYGDRVGLPFRYADAVDIDNLGALGLAMKTAPQLRGSLQRAERYFRLLTDTVAYRLDETGEPRRFTLLQTSDPHPALDLRNECALCGFGRIFKQFVGPDLSYDYVSFAHAAPGDVSRYEAYFGSPVLFEANSNTIALSAPMLDLPTRLGDPAVSKFLTAHLDAELGALADEPSFERTLAEHLSESLSNGIPRAATVAKNIGMSERTLFRRLADAGLTYQDVLEDTQKSLAENLLSESGFSIAEVAFLTGFSEQSTFSRAFKRWVGQTPGAFRRNTQPATA